MRVRARAALLDGALEVFKRKGFHSASMEAIASRAGVSKGLAYHYFAGKEELRAAAVELWIEELAALWDGVDAEPDPLRGLKRVLDRFCDLVERDPERYRFYLTVFFEQDYVGAIRAAGRRSGAHARHINRVHRASRSLFARLGAQDPAAEVVFFRVLTSGLAAEYVMSPRGVPMTAVKKRVMAYYRSLAAPARRRHRSGSA